MSTWFGRKKGKYKAVPTLKHNRTWASKLELAVYEMLLMMERGGAVSDIKCQVHVRFKTEDHGKVIMIPDFSFVETKTAELVYCEAKGFETREWLRKKKAWKIGGPGKLYIYKGSWQRPMLVETIVPKSLEAA